MTAAAALESRADEDAVARQAVIAHLRSCGYRGRGFHGLTADAFREHAEQAYYRAETACRGALLNPAARAAGVNPRDLFHGPWHTARAHASEELLTWWEQGEPRMTLETYRTDQLRSGLDEYRAGHDEDEDTMTTVEDAPTRLVAVPTEDERGGGVTPPPVPPKLTESQARAAWLLDQVCAMLDRFVVFPSPAQRDAAALWILATHARDYEQMLVWNAFGILGFLALSPNAGKTQALTVTAHLAYGDDPTLEMNPSPRGMIQAINEEHTPLFIDNVDTWWTRAGASTDAKAVILAYKYGTRKRILNHKYNLYEATAISALDANLRNNPDMLDVRTRMIMCHMRQKRRDQHVDTWDGRVHDEDAKQLRLAMTAWGKREADNLAMAWPALPDGLTDGRDIELWTSILACGEAGGPGWKRRAVDACKAIALSDAEAMNDAPVESPVDVLISALAEAVDPDEETVSTRELVGRMQRGTYRWKAGLPLQKAAMELAKRLKEAAAMRQLDPIGPVAFWDADRGSVQGYAYKDLAPLLPAPVVEVVDDAEFLPL